MSPRESQFRLQRILEQHMTDAMDKAIRQLLCRCFPADAEVFARSRAWHGSAPAFSVVCRETDATVGHVAIVVRTVACGGEPVTVAGVQSMCVAPERRGTGLAQALLSRAIDESVGRGLEFGLLFCAPALQPFYGAQGWRMSDQPITMTDEDGHRSPIPEKNIAMLIELASRPFPAGPLDLGGGDW